MLDYAVCSIRAHVAVGSLIKQPRHTMEQAMYRQGQGGREAACNYNPFTSLSIFHRFHEVVMVNVVMIWSAGTGGVAGKRIRAAGGPSFDPWYRWSGGGHCGT